MRVVTSGTSMVNQIFWVKPMKVLNVPAMKFDGLNEAEIADFLGMDKHSVFSTRLDDGRKQLVIEGETRNWEVLQEQYIVLASDDDFDIVDALDEEHGYKLQYEVITENRFIEYEEDGE